MLNSTQYCTGKYISLRNYCFHSKELTHKINASVKKITFEYHKIQCITFPLKKDFLKSINAPQLKYQ